MLFDRYERQQKVPKLSPASSSKVDPLQGLSVMRAVSKSESKVSPAEEAAKKEINELKGKLIDREAEVVEVRSEIHKWENAYRKLELALKKERLEFERESEKIVNERSNFEDEIEELKRKIKRMKKMNADAKDLGKFSFLFPDSPNEQMIKQPSFFIEFDERQEARDRRNDFEADLEELREENLKLTEELDDMKVVTYTYLASNQNVLADLLDVIDS